MSFNKTFEDDITFEQARAAFRQGHPQPLKQRVLDKRKKIIARLQKAKK